MKALSLSHLASGIVNIVVVCCALVVTYAVADRFILDPTRPSARPVEPTIQTNWKELFVSGQLAGPGDDSVGMVVFSDYECPACLALHERLQKYEQEGKLPFAVLYRHWPLTKHKFAGQAAVAAECAAEQGRFRPMHDSIFASQAKLGLIPWKTLARGAAVPDTEQFEQCLADEKILSRVRIDAEVAQSLGSRGTPTVILAGGARFVGVPNTEKFDSLIASAVVSVVRMRSKR